ncbi:MAG: hypothetical protein DMG59_25025 [Acidobacteria bacterium]|nr:MAG: hypothetical protein DMG59_25025 [Acidobacteriota bacterium]
MPNQISRRRKIAWVASAILAIAALALIFSRVNRSATLRAYFWLEQTSTEHWPLKRAKSSIEKLAPVLCRLGILGPARVQVEPGVSFLLDPRDLLAVSILRGGEWQPELWDSLAPALSNGSVFLDVGAHIGYFSMKAARRVGKAGRVLAFEPNPETLKLLRDNATANNAQNVIVEPIACTDREQTLTLYAAPTINTGASSLARQNADISVEEAPRPYSVRGRPIDDVVRELNLTRVDAIKIDVEGAEVYVLRGAMDTMRRFHPKLVVEVVPQQLAGFQTTVDDLTSLIRAAGYNLGRPLNPGETDWEWTLQEPVSTVRMADVSASGQLIRGFHELVANTWRWTAGRFTIALQTPRGADENGAWLILKFVIPDVSLNRLKSMTLSAKAGDANLGAETFTTPGEHQYRREVPASALKQDLVNVDFSLDKFLTQGEELGIIVTEIGLAPH